MAVWGKATDALTGTDGEKLSDPSLVSGEPATEVAIPIQRSHATRQLTKSVVVVEDDPLLLDLYPMYLSHFPNFSVVAKMRNGKELVEYLTRIQEAENSGNNLSWPDLIVTDYRMPEMDGLEATKLARLIKPTLKIVLVSAYDLPKEDSGYFDATLRKPFSAEDFAQTIQGLLQ